MTPAGAPRHERILGRLSAILDLYVDANALGRVYHPRSVVRFRHSEVEPDLMVRQELPLDLTDRAEVPIPILVVEVVSEFTRRREHVQKRQFYRDLAIPEYWIVDPDEHSVRVVKPGCEDEVTVSRLAWSPAASHEPLSIDLSEIFGN